MTQPHQPDANDILFGNSGAPALRWHNPSTGQDLPVGTSYEGYITKLDAVQQRNIQDKSKLDTWADGSPKWVPLVTIQTDLRDPEREGDDGQRTLWVSGPYLTNAVRDAVRRVGAPKLYPGGYLKVTLTGYGKSEGGFRAPRLFEVEYTKPQPGTDAANAVLGLAPAQPVAQVPSVQQLMPQPTATVGAQPGGGQMDLASLPPDARALVEKMYAQQQGGGE